jgi:prepilin-type N-terminal cleavage/methylation domain-containing protein
MQSHPTASHAATGLTLLELIVSLSVLGLLCALAYTAVPLGLRSWEAAQVRTNQLDDLRISWRFLHQALTQAKPVSDPDYPSRQILFHGSAQQISFVSATPGEIGPTGLSRITLQAKPPQLQLRLQSLKKDQEPESQPYQTVLSDDLQNLDIAYFGRPQQQATSSWHTQWLSGKRLPELVRIRISTRTLGEWPILWIAPEAAGHVR